MTHFRSGLLAGLAVLALGAGAAQAKDMATTAHDGLNAALWSQSAVEYKANAYAMYALARMRLDEALADTSWTALPDGEQGDDYAGKPAAVILDLDETVMDNSPYQSWLVKADTGFSGKTWTAFVNAKISRQVPGSLAFIEYARSRDVAIFYVTNRKDFEEAATVENLQALGYPVDADGKNVLTRGEMEAWKSSAKSPRRKAIAATHRVLLNIGDNLGDFTDESRGSPAERLAVYEKHQARWGREWIVIANPNYGSWEGSAFGFDYKLSGADKRQRKIDTLDIWSGPN